MRIDNHGVADALEGVFQSGNKAKSLAKNIHTFFFVNPASWLVVERMTSSFRADMSRSRINLAQTQAGTNPIVVVDWVGIRTVSSQCSDIIVDARTKTAEAGAKCGDGSCHGRHDGSEPRLELPSSGGVEWPGLGQFVSDKKKRPCGQTAVALDSVEGKRKTHVLIIQHGAGFIASGGARVEGFGCERCLASCVLGSQIGFKIFSLALAGGGIGELVGTDGVPETVACRQLVPLE